MDSEKIKCIFIIDQLCQFAGTEKHLLELTKHLTKNNFCIIIVAFQIKETVANEFIGNNIRIKSLELNKIYEVKALFKFIRLVLLIKSLGSNLV